MVKSKGPTDLQSGITVIAKSISTDVQISRGAKEDLSILVSNFAKIVSEPAINAAHRNGLKSITLDTIRTAFYRVPHNELWEKLCAAGNETVNKFTHYDGISAKSNVRQYRSYAAGLTLQYPRIDRLLRSYCEDLRLRTDAVYFLMGAIEHLIRKAYEVAIKITIESGRKRVVDDDIKTAVRGGAVGDELRDIFNH